LRFLTRCLTVAAVSMASLAPCWAAVHDDGEPEFRSLFKELIEINTTRSAQACTRAAMEDVRRKLVEILADSKISVTPSGLPGVQSPPPPLSQAVLGPVRQVAERVWPGVVVVPTMSTVATDGFLLNSVGVSTYGLSGLFHDAEGPHIHGSNERVRVASLMNARRFLFEVVKLYANET
jgi:acetylornithine deacetylase/succinyl-diaminopimelate desuccinylase-like protein